MHVTIVVPVLDEEALLPTFLDHLAQAVGDDRACDVIVVDGGSRDASPDLVCSRGIRCLHAPRGRGTQMNAGAEAARGRVLLFLHADTTLPPDALDHVRRARASGAIGGFFGVALESRAWLLRLTGRLISLRSRLTGIATGDQALFVAREEFRGVGGYRDEPLFEDVDLCRRLRRRGHVAALPAKVVTSARRWERGGNLRTILTMWSLRALYSCGVPPRRLARFYGAAR